MAITNHERVGKALEQLNTGLRPFVERELKATYKERWVETARPSFPNWQQSGKDAAQLNWDTQALLSVMWDCGTIALERFWAIGSEPRQRTSRCPQQVGPPEGIQYRRRISRY